MRSLPEPRADQEVDWLQVAAGSTAVLAKSLPEVRVQGHWDQVLMATALSGPGQRRAPELGWRPWAPQRAGHAGEASPCTTVNDFEETAF